MPALQTPHIALLLLPVTLLVQIPVILLTTIAREEDASTAPRIERHTEPHHFPRTERGDKVPAAVAVVDVAPAVVAVDAERGAVPARKTPGGIGRGEEAEGDAGVFAHVKDVQFVVDRPWTRAGGGVDGEVGEEDAVRACPGGADVRMAWAGYGKGDGVVSVWRRGKVEVTSDDAEEGSLVLGTGLPERVLATPGVGAGGVVVGGISDGTGLFEEGWGRRQESVVWDCEPGIIRWRFCVRGSALRWWRSGRRSVLFGGGCLLVVGPGWRRTHWRLVGGWRLILSRRRRAWRWLIGG